MSQMTSKHMLECNVTMADMLKTDDKEPDYI